MLPLFYKYFPAFVFKRDSELLKQSGKGESRANRELLRNCN